MKPQIGLNSEHTIEYKLNQKVDGDSPLRCFCNIGTNSWGLIFFQSIWTRVI